MALGGRSTDNIDLTDAQWERIAPQMPRPRANGHLSSRQALNGWLLITRQGYSWRSLPKR